MYYLERFPRFVASGKSLDGLASIGAAGTGGVSSFGRMLTEAVEKTNHTPEGLIEFLHLRTATTRNAYERSRSWWGRMYNKMTGNHPIYVPISGHHLIQTFVSVGELELSRRVPRNTECGIRVDVAEGYLAKLLNDFDRHGSHATST